jgi:hypothetical protein
LKGGSHVVDDCGNTDSSVAAGIGMQLHDGRVNPYSAGDCHYRCARRCHSGATRIENIPLVSQGSEGIMP